MSLRYELDDAARWVSRDQVIGGTPRRAIRLSESGLQAICAMRTCGPRNRAEQQLARRLCEAGLAHPLVAPATMTQISIVVPVRDRPAELARCLASIGPHDDLIVVDDRSRRPELIAEAAATAGARLVCNEGPPGPASARNAGLRAARHRLVAFVDSDCVVSGQALRKLAGHLIDGDVGAVAPRIREGAEDGSTRLARYLAYSSPLDMGPLPAEVGPTGRVRYVPSAAVVARIEAVSDGFDPALRYGEDVDLVWRLREAGWRVRYDPSIEVRHQAPADIGRCLKRRACYGSSAAALSRRHPAVLAHPLTPWIATSGLAGLAGRPWLALGSWLAGTALAARRMTGVPAAACRAAQLTAEAHWETALGLGRAATTLSPLAILAVALVARRSRLAGLALALSPHARDYARLRPSLGPGSWLAIRLADEAAYGIGVAAGCLRARHVGPWHFRLTCRPNHGRRLRASAVGRP